MRAVNLLPTDLRRAASPKPARGPRPEPVQGIGAYVLLGALALCVAALASYILVSNGVKQRETDLVAAQQRSAAAATKASQLKPYADFQALASARVETVRGLAAARFDWERALRDISHAVPADVKLDKLMGDIGLPGTSSGGDPLRGSISAPAISLTGCATSHAHVARMMARIKAVSGVTRVSLSKSEMATSDSTVSPCGGEKPPVFSAVAFFEGAKAVADLAPATATQSSPVPVPNAVAGTAPAADGTTPAGTEPTAAGATPTPTPTTPGSTP